MMSCRIFDISAPAASSSIMTALKYVNGSANTHSVAQCPNADLFPRRRASQHNQYGSEHPTTGPGLREVERDEASNPSKVPIVVRYQHTSGLAA